MDIKSDSELTQAISNLKNTLWAERWGFVRLYVVCTAFLLGAALEHYFPDLLPWLWK